MNPDFGPSQVTPETQAFIEQLADAEAMSAEQIAEVGELDIEQVKLCMVNKRYVLKYTKLRKHAFYLQIACVFFIGW